MPKNKGLGGKKRRKGKLLATTKRELVLKEIGQEYAQIVKSSGCGFMELLCFSSSGNITRRGHIRGKMRKREWLSPGDIVLVNVRDFQEDTCDIVMKYTSDEARILRSRNVIPVISNITCESNDDPSIGLNIKFGEIETGNVPEDDVITKEFSSNDLDWCTKKTKVSNSSDSSDSSDSSNSSDLDDSLDDLFNR